MPQPLGTKTVGEVITWATEQFGDVANVQIDSPKIIRWINMAILEIVSRDQKAYQGKFTQASVANQNEYTFPSNLIHTSMVKFGSKPLQQISFELIQIQTEDAFTGEVGIPRYWSQHANVFQLWPVPNSVDTITVYGSAKPANVTNAADLLPLPDKYFPRICEYVEAMADYLDENPESAAARMTRFEDQLRLGQNSADAVQGALYPVLRDPDEEWEYAD